MWKKNAKDKFPESYKQEERLKENAARLEQERIENSHYQSSNSSSDELDSWKLGNIVRNACTEYSFGFPTKGYIRYYSDYCRESYKGSGSWEIEVRVNVSYYSETTTSDVKNGLDNFTDYLFNKLESRLDKYDIGFDLEVEINDTYSID